MKLYRGAILIEANQLMSWHSKLNGLQGKAWAGALYPFIFTTKKIPVELRNVIINHELIHFAQQKEMLFVGAWLLGIVEWVYWRIIKRKSAKQTYLLRCVEQEAYAQMFNRDYLVNRPKYAHLRNYLKNKPVSSTLTEKVL